MTDDARLPPHTGSPVDERRRELRRLLPEVFVEGKLDMEKLRTALGDDAIATGRERYGLCWAGKSEAVRTLLAPGTGTLRPCPDESVNFDNAENLIIEGDNLEVLKLLQKSYHGKVKLIYIDPPYNTGNDFIYADDFRSPLDAYRRYTGELGDDGKATTTNRDTSGRFHSNWLNMMYPRLHLARNLLREDGVIFVSIDDNEVHNLRMVMNEVFGEENFIAQISVVSNPKGRTLGEHFARTHDYIVVYGMHGLDEELAVAKTDAEIQAQYTEHDVNGPFRTLELRNTHRQFGRHNRPKMWFTLYANPENGEVSPISKTGWIPVDPVWDDGFEGCWTWGLPLVKSDLHLLTSRMVNGKWKIYRKAYARDPEGNAASKKLKSVWTEKEFHTEKGQETFDSLVPGRLFQSPKPVALIQAIASTSTGQGDLVLDFFGGSGTTAHAVLEMNEADGGNRKFILVQLPEKTDKPEYPTIAHITRERVRRVIKRIKDARADKASKQDLLPTEEGTTQVLGFRALRLAASNFHTWDADTASPDPEQLKVQLAQHAENLVTDRHEQDRLFELMLRAGLPLSARIDTIAVAQQGAWRITEDEQAHLFCLADRIEQATLDALRALKPASVICLDAAFAGNDALKTNTVLQMKDAGIRFHTA